jgi:hypothetical protein
MKFFDETDEGPAMLRVVAQAILLAAGIVAAFFVTRPNAAFPFYHSRRRDASLAAAAIKLNHPTEERAL